MGQIFLIALGALGLAALLYWLWAGRTRAEIRESAALNWRRRSETDPESVAGLSEAQFTAVFERVHFPRLPKYALAAAAAFVVASPVTFYILGAISWAMGSLGMSPDAERLARAVPVEGAERLLNRDDGETVAMLWISDILLIGYYFGLLIVWIAIVAGAMRRYHARRPGYLDEELAIARTKGAAP